MDILNKGTIIIKVINRNYYNKFTFEPSYKRIERICGLIEKSKLFIHYGKSRIDGNEIYILNKMTIRSIKINKITNKMNVVIKLDNLMKEIKDDIEYVSVLK